MTDDIREAILHEQVLLSIYKVVTGSYESLHVMDVSYPHWTLSHVLYGHHVETITCGERQQVRQGDVMLHPPHIPFSEFAPGSGTHQWMVFSASVSHNIDLFQLYSVPVVTPLLNISGFSSTFETLLEQWTNASSPFRNISLSALTLQLCGIVLESWRCAGSPPRSPTLMTPQDRFIHVITYMSEHLDQKLTREDLAQQVHLHPGYFGRAFRATYGMTPMQMLQNLRLRRALQLLETTDAPLTAIALSCGLGDAGYFSRVFRQHYGQAPGEYRQSVKSTTMSYISPL